MVAVGLYAVYKYTPTTTIQGIEKSVEEKVVNAWDFISGKWNDSQQAIIKKIVDISKQMNFDTSLALGLAEQENRFRNTPSSDGLSYGIFQIEPRSAQEVMGGTVTPEKLMNDEDFNIRAGITYLKKQIDHFNDIPSGIAAYNHGASNIEEGKFDPSTDYYTQKVLGYQNDWSNPVV